MKILVLIMHYYYYKTSPNFNFISLMFIWLLNISTCFPIYAESWTKRATMINSRQVLCLCEIQSTSKSFWTMYSYNLYSFLPTDHTIFAWQFANIKKQSSNYMIKLFICFIYMHIMDWSCDVCEIFAHPKEINGNICVWRKLININNWNQNQFPLINYHLTVFFLSPTIQ